MIATHLSDDDLADFLTGRLPADRFEHLMQHLDECGECQQRASRSTSDDSLAGVLAAGVKDSHDPVLAEADCQAAIFHAAGSPEMRLDRVLPPIETLGPYRLIRPLGRGGMGAVYLAEHARLRKQVAIKLLPRQHGFDPNWVGRFQREMQAIASLSHPGIITATDAGETNGWHYLVMEYLDGLDLAAIVGRVGPLDAGVAASIMRDVCDALAVVHHAGLVHRDIKPSNIMLTRDGTVKLLDLGLVLDQRESIVDDRLTTVGHVLGTLAFAAPEQLSHEPTVDARADLYAVGATLFQLVTGRTPHTSDRGIGPLVIEKTSKPAASLHSVAPETPDELNALVADLLQRDPAERPAGAEDVARRLDFVAINGKNRSLVGKAMRATGLDNKNTSGSMVGYPVLPPPLPPSGRAWKWIAAGGISIGLLILATVITIQFNDATVQIETDDPDIKITVAEREQQPSTEPNTELGVVEIEPPPEKSKPQKLFKGKTLGEWADLMLIERDVDTLGDAMRAVANLADAEDVTEAQSLLIAARRFGGWSSSDKSSDPSLRFMHALHDAVATKWMWRPGIDAINNELPAGNENSRAAALWLLRYFIGHSNQEAELLVWLEEPGNRSIAFRLHQNLQKLLRNGELENEMSLSVAQHLSLVLAIALDAPIEEEPGLRDTLQQMITQTESTVSAAERLDQKWSTGSDPITLPEMTPEQFVAATRLNMDIPVSLAAAMLTTLGKPNFRAERVRAIRGMLDSEPQQASDSLLAGLSLNFSEPFSNGGSFDQLMMSQPNFWMEVLPIVTENTTRPDILEYVISSQSVNYWDQRGGAFDDSFAPTDAMLQAFQASGKRTRERMKAESIPESFPFQKTTPGGGGMF